MAKRSERFQDRTRKLHRLLTTLRKIDNRERCTPQALAQQFDTTDRNIYRDINDLNSSGFSILFDRESKTYRFTDPDFTLRDLDLNNEELRGTKRDGRLSLLTLLPRGVYSFRLWC